MNIFRKQVQTLGVLLSAGLIAACTTGGGTLPEVQQEMEQLIANMDPAGSAADVPISARAVLDAAAVSSVDDVAVAFDRLAAWLSERDSATITSSEAESLVERLATPELDETAYGWWCCGEWETWWHCFTDTGLCGYCAHGPGAC